LVVLGFALSLAGQALYYLSHNPGSYLDSESKHNGGNLRIEGWEKKIGIAAMLSNLSVLTQVMKSLRTRENVSYLTGLK
jgi:hypothetical protein